MEYIFGPVASRRFGLSLGINVIPHKVCSFDCLYCEVGKTVNLTFERKSFFDINELTNIFKEKYNYFKGNIDVVTITGAGEPTLNSDLKKIAITLKKIIKEPLALLTNSSLINERDVMDAMLEFDIVVPSLDAVSGDVFKKINRPHKNIDIENIKNGLIKFSNDFQGILYPEVLVLKNINDNESEIKKISEVINLMKYETVHLTTAFRPVPYKEAKALNEEELFNISLLFAKYGVKIKISNFFQSNTNEKNIDINIENAIFKLLSMRPCSYDDICNIFSINEQNCKKLLTDMLKKNKIKKIEHNNAEFFSSANL